MGLVTSHGLFHDLDNQYPRAARQVCYSAVRPLFAHAFEDLFNIGDAGSKMFFVDKGTLGYRRDCAAQLCMGSEILNDQQASVDVSERSATVVFVKLRASAWIAEPALWCEWAYQGRLSAESDACLFTMEVGELATSLHDYREALAMTVLYARSFLREVRGLSMPTDLM